MAGTQMVAYPSSGDPHAGSAPLRGTSLRGVPVSGSLRSVGVGVDRDRPAWGPPGTITTESATEPSCWWPAPYRRENGGGTARDAFFCLAGLSP